MAELAGYLDRWSAAPGEALDVHLWSSAPVRARVELVRLGRGPLRDEPGGIAFEPVRQLPPQHVALRPLPTDAGSYAQVDLPGVALDQGCLALLAQPWSPGTADAPDAPQPDPGAAGAAPGDGQPLPGGQVIVALEGTPAPLCVLIEADGFLALQAGATRARTHWCADVRRWLLLSLSWRGGAAALTVADAHTGDGASVRVQIQPLGGAVPRLTLAGRPCGAAAAHDAPQAVTDHFDGRLERPLLWPAPQALPQVRQALRVDDGLPAGAIAAWDFAPDGAGGVSGFGAASQSFRDLGPLGLHGRFVQGPKRAVRGMRWSGTHLDWRDRPSHHAAVHFHRDDLEDAQWPVAARLVLPASLPSGAYAVRVSCEGAGAAAVDAAVGAAGPVLELTGGLCRLPLFVRPRPDAAVAPHTVALVFPTFTYLAYGNDRCALHGHNPEVLADRAIMLEPADVLLSQHPAWGLSLYDTHHDGSGVALASRRRPLPTLQPDQRSWQAGEGSGRWNYPGDLLLVEWLEREGIAWHALTDEDLDAGGADVLARYRLVLTGNHPEYATPALVAAYQGHLARGGRLMYLGGNGFYWRIASHRQRPGVIELRRAEDGNRSWAEEPCEYFHAFDGGYGGLWRRSGLAPQSWLGVGYAGQGFRRSTGLRRAADAARPEAAFVFDGVPDGNFGLNGAMGGGCAGIEVDRRDLLLGSDPAGWWLATSLPFDATYLVANEELLVSRPTIAAPYAPALRADVVLQPMRGGAAVFSVGSIAWIGGLALHGGDAAVQRITRNVLDRLLDPAPLVPDPPDWVELAP